MDHIEQLQELMSGGVDDVSIILVIFNFLGAIFVSFIVRSFYIHYSRSLSGKNHIGSVIPLLTAIVFLVIVIVKTSLALSLGLVGALSIVRFRTPIKEPEELVYLFLAIAIGLGFGAGHFLITTAITLLTLLMVYFFLSNNVAKALEYNLVINWSNLEVGYNDINEKIQQKCNAVSLVRLEQANGLNTVVLLIELSKNSNIDDLVHELKIVDSGISFTFFESHTNL